MLEKRVVELGIVEKASDTTIFRVLKKNEVKPHKKKCWVIPPCPATPLMNTSVFFGGGEI